jgi:hypothetical protein
MKKKVWLLIFYSSYLALRWNPTHEKTGVRRRRLSPACRSNLPGWQRVVDPAYPDQYSGGGNSSIASIWRQEKSPFCQCRKGWLSAAGGSPDGRFSSPIRRRLKMESAGYTGLYWIPAGGSEGRAAAGTERPLESFQPTWSPDGRCYYAHLY